MLSFIYLIMSLGSIVQSYKAKASFPLAFYVNSLAFQLTILPFNELAKGLVLQSLKIM